MTTQLTRYLLTSLIFLAPLFFWTLTLNFFESSKGFLLLITSTILFLIYAVSTFKTRILVLPKSRLTLPLLAFLAAIILSLAINAEARAEAISGKGAMLLILPLLSLFILTTKNHTKLISGVKLALIASSSFLAIHSLAQLTFLSRLTLLPIFMQTMAFTPTGSFLTTLALIVIGAGAAIAELKTSSPRTKIIFFLALLLDTIAAVAIISLMLPGSALTPALIPYIESWSIALDALKSTRSLVFGVGIAGFSTLYTSVKPLSLNLTSLWSSLPPFSGSELLTMLATTGVLGTASLVYLMFKGLLSSSSSSLAVPLTLTILALVLIPGSLSIYLLFFTLLALTSHEGPETRELSPHAAHLTALAILALVLTSFIYLIRPYIAEFYMRRAQLALIQNDGRGVYDNHLQALRYYPSMTGYHLSLADVNLNIAGALSQKPDLTEEDRTTISTLIQQSISEGKTAIALRPNYATAWITLAKVYRNIIGVADGADQFAIQAYTQAITLDPANPALRVEFGGLFYQLALSKDKPADQLPLLNRAVQEFQLAIQLKKDYANAYYNLAKTLEIGENYEGAAAAMTQAVAYTTPDSADFQKAQGELDVLKAKLPRSEAKTPSGAAGEVGSTTLSEPSPLPSPIDGGPIELPADSPAPNL